MAPSVESSPPDSLKKESTLVDLWVSSSPAKFSFSPSSDKRFWSALRSRTHTLLLNRNPLEPSFSIQTVNYRESDHSKLMEEDSLLVLRGFDSVSSSLSQLSQNLDNALRGARDLARRPTMAELYQSAAEKAKEEEEENDGRKRELKRKIDAREYSNEQGDDLRKENNEKSLKAVGKLKKAKNLAMSMATRAASLARELKSIKSNLGFVQERCSILEEENRRLRDGFNEEIRPEEDDLVRLQLEALLAEKSRLANENANLTRENQCLQPTLKYYQLTSQDLSPSYEQVIKELCLDFSPPPPAEENIDADGNELLKTPQMEIFGLSTSLNECHDEEQQNIESL